jgi:hypothetical protein
MWRYRKHCTFGSDLNETEVFVIHFLNHAEWELWSRHGDIGNNSHQTVRCSEMKKEKRNITRTFG